MSCKIEDYNGTDIVVLRREDDDTEFGFRFGFQKAKLICDNIKGIQDYVKDMESKEENDE